MESDYRAGLVCQSARALLRQRRSLARPDFPSRGEAARSCILLRRGRERHPRRHFSKRRLPLRRKLCLSMSSSSNSLLGRWQQKGIAIYTPAFCVFCATLPSVYIYTMRSASTYFSVANTRAKFRCSLQRGRSRHKGTEREPLYREINNAISGKEKAAVASVACLCFSTRSGAWRLRGFGGLRNK